MSDSLSTRLGPGRSALLYSPPMSQSAGDACTELLLSPEGESPSALWVTYTRAPEDGIRDWLDALDTDPGNVGVVSVGERDVESVRDVTGVTDPRLETISNPSDLTGLGITLQNVLDDWEGDISLCFDSLTSLLQYVDVETAYEFLHVLTGRLYAQDVRAHFHIDPDAHDEQTVAAIASLMDAVVRVDDGAYDVDTRVPSED